MRPERFELPTLCFEGRGREIPNAFSSVAYGCKTSENCPSVGLRWATKLQPQAIPVSIVTYVRVCDPKAETFAEHYAHPLRRNLLRSTATAELAHPIDRQDRRDRNLLIKNLWPPAGGTIVQDRH